MVFPCPQKMLAPKLHAICRNVRSTISLPFVFPKDTKTPCYASVNAEEPGKTCSRNQHPSCFRVCQRSKADVAGVFASGSVLPARSNVA